MINYQFNIKWSRKLGQMGPVGSTRTSQAKDVSALMDMVSCLIKSVDTVIKRQNDLQETLNDKEAECTTLRDENRRSSEAWLPIWLLPTSRPLIVDICWLLSSSHLPVVDICWWLSV